LHPTGLLINILFLQQRKLEYAPWIPDETQQIISKKDNELIFLNSVN
jgi:hypothetical protein